MASHAAVMWLDCLLAHPKVHPQTAATFCQLYLAELAIPVNRFWVKHIYVVHYTVQNGINEIITTLSGARDPDLSAVSWN